MWVKQIETPIMMTIIMIVMKHLIPWVTPVVTEMKILGLTYLGMVLRQKRPIGTQTKNSI